MGSREKVRRFLEESEAHRHYEGIVDYALTYLVAKAEREGQSGFAADLARMKGEYKEDFANAVALTEDVFADPRCRINEQVTGGLALRCALLCWACGKLDLGKGGKA